MNLCHAERGRSQEVRRISQPAGGVNWLLHPQTDQTTNTYLRFVFLLFLCKHVHLKYGRRFLPSLRGTKGVYPALPKKATCIG